MNDGPLAGWHLRALLWSVALAAAGYLAFSLWGGWQEVVAAAARVGVAGMLLVLAMSLLNYGLRFLRWQAYLGALGHRVPWQPSLRIYLAGFALTTTPGKAGEALRGVFLKHWQVPYPHSFAAFFSERLSDLFAIVLLTLFGLSVYPQAQPLILLGMALVCSAWLVLSQQALLAKFAALLPAQGSRIIGLLRQLLQVLAEAQRCHRPGMIATATLLSLVAWGAEAVAFWWVLQWMGAEVSLAFAVFVYAIAMLAGALSFMPGGLGGAEAAMIGLLVWKGMPAADAVAATVLIRLATLWFA
ncbi:MAG: YbhN family protein, partial [Gammaproteobacteria bacterium]